MLRRIFARSFTVRDALVSILLVSLLLPGSFGCAVFRAPVPPGFDVISIRAEVERDRKGRVEGDLKAYSTLKGVLVGAALGGPTLALTAGGVGFGVSIPLCAPIAAISLFLAPVVWVACVGVITIGSTAAGFVVGLGSGMWIGAVGGLPSETAKRVTAALDRVEAEGSFDDDVLTAMRQAVPQEKQTAVSNADAVVIARLEGVELHQHSKDRLSIRVEASMEQIWEGEDATTKKNTCEYRYDSDKRSAKKWLANDGIAFRESITQGIEIIAQWMNRDLEAFATKTEFKKTGDAPATCFRRWRWYDNFSLF